MKDQARIVVIGGGVFGTSVAYHLAKMGCSDVVLLDKGELTSGTTFHSVGLVSQFRTSPALMKMMNYSIRLFNELARGDGGPSLGWRTVGSLRLASSPDRLKALKREVSRAKAIGLAADIISAREVVERCPFISDEGLYGSVWVPDDGYIDPNGITYELARQARTMGVEIQTHVRVTGIDLSPRREVTRVTTDHGAIRTECVVNAAGEWAPRLAEMVGAFLPTVPLMHQYLTTKPIPGHVLAPTTPVIRDPDNLFYCREDTGAFLIGAFETNPKEWTPAATFTAGNRSMPEASWSTASAPAATVTPSARTSDSCICRRSWPRPAPRWRWKSSEKGSAPRWRICRWWIPKAKKFARRLLSLKLWVFSAKILRQD
jgi:4-methylaminobutanoate oxidase (formaldehyde-forming)